MTDEAVLDRAEALLDIGRPEEARRLLAGAPDDSRALCLLARSFEATGDHEEMLAAAGRASAADPEDEWARRLQAIALIHLDRPGEGLDGAREAVRLAPETWQGQVTLAAALAAAGLPRRETFAACRRAIELAPDEAETHYVHGMMRHYLSFAWLARRSYRRALSRDPQHAGALARLGQIHAAGGKVADAVRYFQASAAADPAAVDLAAPVDRALLRVPSWGLVAMLPVAMILMFGFEPLAWPLAGGALVWYAVWANRVHRALPDGARPLLLDRLRGDARFLVRVWCAGLMLVVAVGIGVVSAMTLSADSFDGRTVVILELSVLGAFCLAVAAVRVTDRLAERRRARGRTPGAPAELDEPDRLDGAGKFMMFRWFRASCVAALAVITVDPLEAAWGVRAAAGGAALAGLALYCYVTAVLARRARRPGWRDRLWQRVPEIPDLAVGVVFLAPLGFIVVTMLSPTPGNDVQMLFAVFAFLLMGIAVLANLVWLPVVIIRTLLTLGGAGSDGPGRTPVPSRRR